MPIDATPKLTAPVFIVGHPRSGTTLLASVLGRHPNFAATPETHFFNEVRFALAPRMTEGKSAVLKRLANGRMQHMTLPAEVQQAALDVAEWTPEGVFEALLTAFLEQQDKPRIVEKTPVHLRHIPEIFKRWPDAKVIWILRDGRACVSSLLKLAWASDDPEVLARQWTRNMAFVRAAQRAFPDKVIRLRYEELLTDAPASLARVMDALGETPVPEMFDPDSDATTVSPFEADWKANVSKPLMASRLDAWRGELPADTILRISDIMASQLDGLGYSTAGSTTPRRHWEGLRGSLIDGRAGRAAQMWLYRKAAGRRFARPDTTQMRRTRATQPAKG